MNNGYQEPHQAKNYEDFLASKDGIFQRKIVLEAVLNRLQNSKKPLTILDLGCGPGWLCHELTELGFNAQGCDISHSQINLAKKKYSKLNFVVADPQSSLPYTDNQFDIVIAAFSVCDMPDQPKALKEIRRVLKQGGKFINIIPNPYYTLPVAQWKRSLFGKLFFKKPNIKLLPYFSFVQKREFMWRDNLKRHFYTLAEEINNLISAGFKLDHYEELKAKTDDRVFSRQHQLHRFPLYLLLECS